MVPVGRQQPNRHENLTVSTKGQCQTKPLVVSEEAPEQAESGSATLPSFIPQLDHVFLTSQRPGRESHVCLLFHNLCSNLGCHPHFFSPDLITVFEFL